MTARCRRTVSGQTVTELTLVLCLVSFVAIPAVKLLCRTTRDTVNTAVDFNTHSALAAGETRGTPAWAYGEAAPAAPADPPGAGSGGASEGGAGGTEGGSGGTSGESSDGGTSGGRGGRR